MKTRLNEFANYPLGYALYLTLRKSILNGEIQPGKRLTEVEISKKMEVSRTPVREAFRRLETERLLIRTPGGKFIVANPDTQEIREIYLVRSVLEGLAAKIAASKVKPQDLRELKNAVQKMEEGIKKNQITWVVDSNLEFHQLIVRMSGNHILTQTLNRLWDTIQIWSVRSLSNRAWTLRSVREHKKIIEALEKGDGDTAEKLIRDHIEHASDVFLGKD